jgi:hypothetical protein
MSLTAITSRPSIDQQQVFGDPAKLGLDVLDRLKDPSKRITQTRARVVERLDGRATPIWRL